MNVQVLPKIAAGPAYGDRLEARLKNCFCLPIHPSIFLKLMELGKKADAAPEQYAELIASSQSLSAKLLATVNSSWFGLSHRVKKVTQAVNLLGTANIRLLAITHCLASVHAHIDLSRETLEMYWEAGLLKASAAQWLAEQIEPSLSDEAFLMGLMQDLALPIMHSVCEEPYVSADGSTVRSATQLRANETDAFGMDHGEAAVVLGEALGLPGFLTSSFRVHHDRVALQVACASSVLADVIYFASLLPHVPNGWDDDQALQAGAFLRQRLGGEVFELAGALREIEARFRMVVGYFRAAESRNINLEILLHDAAREMDETTMQLVGQLHSVMNGAVEADRELSVRNIEAIQFEEQTREDSLCGVLNRNGLQQVGELMLQSLRHSDGSVCVWFADVDNFKHINDTYGHLVGDKMLRHVTDRMQEVFGPKTLIARYGGDEFVVVQGNVAKEADALAMAEQFLKRLNEPSNESGDQEVSVTMSIGGVWYSSARAAGSVQQMVAEADQQMYQAKTSGKNRVKLISVAAQ